MLFETLSAEAIATLSLDELDAENQRTGLAIDELREYRQQLKVARSAQTEAADIRAKHGEHLTDEQVQTINAVIKAPRLTMTAEVNNG